MTLRRSSRHRRENGGSSRRGRGGRGRRPSEEEQRRSVDSPDSQQEFFLLIFAPQNGKSCGVREPREDREALAGHPGRSSRRRRRRKRLLPDKDRRLGPGERDKRRLFLSLVFFIFLCLFSFFFFVPREGGNPRPGLDPQERRLLPEEVAAGRKRRRGRRRTAALVAVALVVISGEPHPPGGHEAVRGPRGELCPAAAAFSVLFGNGLGALPADAADAARGARGAVAVADASFLAQHHHRRSDSSAPLVVEEHGRSSAVRYEVAGPPVQRSRHGVDACGDVGERDGDGGRIIIVGRWCRC